MGKPNMLAPTPESVALAAQVFAIPELMEHNLLTLAKIVSNDPRYRGFPIYGIDADYRLEPATTFARCHMVNRDFHVTICGSSKLLRVTECASDHDGRDSYTNALGWLFQQQLKLKFRDLKEHEVSHDPTSRLGPNMPRYKIRSIGNRDVKTWHNLRDFGSRRAMRRRVGVVSS
ncbi:hypothetical protein CLAFUW4_06951 [Fulvia fulva]|uniref:Uncharacterized protein n=1 Tax=Passalora fulva TaxID=5499 RepID=A0A9Q8UR25_PASFU|nr:uncharacterized protein CLAFUR5_07088 [Fulvia fulva]KAK4622147.1 hypothetical protein CLAFUR4_06960 [Fulvia fulva]KAK4622548.1 hypothetical protein CLAFUR0_06958 [Fulvia fulva]UJO19270.1 hypothetical protein CLAFUR5_07088 [Fulvia fulva]WPV16751.1 hypothetical protein CLAFUW4_06951 [Fulvia fulva]WPV31511.1 hypothetical protein CLAFUW7_06951 [Fulvia fulva]